MDYREKCPLAGQLASHEVEQVRIGSFERDVRLCLPVEFDFPLAILGVHNPCCLSALVSLHLEGKDPLDFLNKVLAICLKGGTDSVKYPGRLEVAWRYNGILVAIC